MRKELVGQNRRALLEFDEVDRDGWNLPRSTATHSWTHGRASAAFAQSRRRCGQGHSGEPAPTEFNYIGRRAQSRRGCGQARHSATIVSAPEDETSEISTLRNALAKDVSQFVNLNTILSSVSSWTSICGSFRLLAIGRGLLLVVPIREPHGQCEKTVEPPVGTGAKLLAVTRQKTHFAHAASTDLRSGIRGLLPDAPNTTAVCTVTRPSISSTARRSPLVSASPMCCTNCHQPPCSSRRRRASTRT